MHCLDRAHDTGFKAKAFVRALDVVRARAARRTAPAGRRRHAHRSGRHRRQLGRRRSSARRSTATTCRTWPTSTPRRRCPSRRRATCIARRSRATCTCTAAGATAARPSRRWPARRSRARPRVHGAHRSLAAPHGRSRSQRRATGGAARRRAGAERAVGAVPHPHRHRGRHPGGRHARPRRRGAVAARRGRGQRAQQAAHGRRRDDGADGAGGGQPARRHPRPLHGSPDRQARPVHASTPTTCSPPVPSSTRPSRSTAAPNGSTLRDRCCGWRSSTAAASPSTPMPTATGQLEWQPHGCDRAAEWGCRSNGCSTHGRSTSCSVGSRGSSPVGLGPMSKKTKKRKARLRRSKANHGKRPNMGRG